MAPSSGVALVGVALEPRAMIDPMTDVYRREVAEVTAENERLRERVDRPTLIDSERDQIRWRCLARLELACDTARELEAVVTTSIRGARSSGATWKEIQTASGMKLSTI